MDSSRALAHVLRLFAGELRDSAGEILTPAARPIILVHDDADIRAGLAEGRRVAVAVPVASPGAMNRIISLCLARFRIRSARRRLATAGANRVRAFAIVTAAETLFLVYELGDTSQTYVENYIVFEPPAARPVRVAKRVLRTVSGVPTSVDVVVVIGAPT